MRTVLVLLVVLVLGGFFVLPAGEAGAQGGGDLLLNAACRDDPYSEECICEGVARMSRFPKHFKVGPNGEFIAEPDPASPPGAPPIEFDTELNVWVGGIDDDFEVKENSKYKAYCALAYYEENQRRLVLLVIAVGSVLAAVGLGWAGFVHMQESAAGETRSTSRTIVIRALLGMLILSLVFVIWEAFAGSLLGGLDYWQQVPGVLENF